MTETLERPVKTKEVQTCWCCDPNDPTRPDRGYNAETLEAMQEALDIISGKIQAKRYSSFEEFWADLENDDDFDDDFDDDVNF
ncbi:MAG: hypothetical protein LBN97_02580 [Oscillospiraceae bacterium]|nr:hypothetical protein [Oscillospiraceae bacterium]